jgi:hypothetical protein
MASDYPFGIFKCLVTVLSDLLFMASDYPIGIFKRLVIVLTDLLFMASDYPFGIFKRFVIDNDQTFENTKGVIRSHK